MPNYDYKCSLCSHELEAFQKITDEPLLTCPKCQKEGLKRGIGGGSASFQFKGSGFYITDCKNKGSCECSKSE